jgi:magnesium transporter
VVMGAIVSVWFGDWTISIVIAAAMAINLMAAAVAGTLLPVILRSLKIDPALAGSVILTTVTDIVGFVSFLGLATVFYS